MKYRMCVFSNYLDPLREENLIALTDDPKPSEVYDALRIAYNQGAPGILNNTRMIAPITEEEDNYDIIEEVWRNSHLQFIVRWINRKITLCIGIETYRTLGVRVRIATSMINKLVNEGYLSKRMSMRIHYYLCENVRNESSLVVNEELPF